LAHYPLRPTTRSSELVPTCYTNSRRVLPIGFEHPAVTSLSPFQRRGLFLSNKIYIGNLPFSSTEDELRSLFSQHGAVDSVNVIMDRDTGRARGFAFVEMSDAADVAKAIKDLDGSELGGRNLRVNEAEDKPRGGGFRDR